MKKIIFSISVLLTCTVSLFAQITREQADAIVRDYVQNEITRPVVLFTNLNEPDETGIVITTSNGETIKAKYACWSYYFDEAETAGRRYIFVKEENGSLLEVIANNDFSESGISWVQMNVNSLESNKANNLKLLYPNPVGDMLIFSCGENARVEIYDLKGSSLFSGMFSGTCQLNVSFLNTGIYLVNISGETYKIIKN